MVACEECSSPQVTGLRWYHWLEFRSRWRRQQYRHFDTACQRPKGKLHFLFAVMIPPSAARYFRHLPAMSIKTTLHATAPLLYPCRRYPKCPWGLYASPPPVAMAVVGWFLCFPGFFFFFGKMGFFFPYATYAKKKKLRDLHPLFVLPPFRLRTGDHYLCVCTDLLKIYCVFVKQHAGLSLPV